MFFQESTPDTSGYLIAGYAIAFLVMALYVASIYLRSRNLHQDLNVLEDLEKSTPAEVQSAPKNEPKKRQTRTQTSKSAKPVTKRTRKK